MSIPMVKNGILHDPNGRPICAVSTEAAPSTAWTRWLQNPANRSFRFIGERGGFLAVHQERRSKTDSAVRWAYWYAQIKPRGRTFHRSLGPIRNAAAVTLERMELAAAKLAVHIPRVDFRESGVEKSEREKWREALRQKPPHRLRVRGDEADGAGAEQLALFDDEAEAGPALGDYDL